MLEKGDYDWAYLAMNDRLDRVREKYKTDKSLARAHGLENLCLCYVWCGWSGFPRHRGPI